MARTLVLGGAGFIGYHLVRHLAESGQDRVTVVDNLSRGRLDRDMEQLLADHPQVELTTGDLTVPGTFGEIRGSFDRVYLLAGIVGVRNVEADPARVLQANTAIIMNTLEWIRQEGCGRLMFASTSETYAGSVESGIAPVPTAEEAPLAILDIQHPRYCYALTKMLGEAAVTHYSRKYSFEAAIVRYHNVYGPRMGFDHVIPELMERIYQRRDPMPVYGLDQTRAFCYVTDAVEASVALMECRIEGCEIVHVGNGNEEIAVGELLQKLLETEGFHPTVQPLPAPSGAVARRCPDISKLSALTEFQPRVGIDQGLVLTWDWYRERLAIGEGVVGSHKAGGSRA